MTVIHYLKQFVADIIAKKPRDRAPTYQDQLRTIAEEMDRFDPRDFEPAVQAEFLHNKTVISWLARTGQFSESVMMSVLQPLPAIFDAYRGPGSGKSVRSFAYISDPELRRIIDRDYAELTIRLFPAGAWKSTVVMAGSILEAILHDVLSDPKRRGSVNGTPHAVSIRGRKGLVENGGWDLVDLIRAAADPSVGVLTPDRAETVDQVLRDYRNFVHPKKEIRAKHECREAEAGLAKYGLDGVCDHFDRTL